MVERTSGPYENIILLIHKGSVLELVKQEDSTGYWLIQVRLDKRVLAGSSGVSLMVPDRRVWFC